VALGQGCSELLAWTKRAHPLQVDWLCVGHERMLSVQVAAFKDVGTHKPMQTFPQLFQSILYVKLLSCCVFAVVVGFFGS